ncbi:alpha/beta hydrolase, partial [Rhizobium johnstonii]
MRMSTSHCTIITAIAAFFLSAAILSAVGPAEAADALPPFKDDLFSKQTVLQTGDDGAFEVVDYDEMRDINGRDQIPQKRVQQKYVALGIRKAQADETLSLDGIKLDVTRVGPAGNAAFTVIFIHGRDGDRRLGANYYSFGGNFNTRRQSIIRI